MFEVGDEVVFFEWNYKVGIVRTIKENNIYVQTPDGKVHYLFREELTLRHRPEKNVEWITNGF